ncbi:hypothetical protein SCLCIDRAFT_591798 [Scleroderma citrinum Foug A]|uniref:Uncharacterized protein n=1 Tax=Scleroderma citrinum Foug A TaxID=1036808 RepID=A0A0C3E8P6_9AGAM|nr:hypothetical protein SCLCIDRAFT_591798 [Scleroderma citrinum Foug A]
MPMVYGEGKKVCHRLQLEIIRMSNDQSIFAWGCRSRDNLRNCSILADDPNFFRGCSSMVPINSSKNSGIVSQKKSCPPSRVIIAPWHIPDHQSWHPNLAVSPSLRGLSLRLPGLVAALLSCIGCTSDHQYSIVYGILNITSILRGFRAMSYKGNFTFPPRIESPLSLHRTALQQIGGRFARLG